MKKGEINKRLCVRGMWEPILVALTSIRIQSIN